MREFHPGPRSTVPVGHLFSALHDLVAWRAERAVHPHHYGDEWGTTPMVKDMAMGQYEPSILWVIITNNNDNDEFLWVIMTNNNDGNSSYHYH